MPRKSRRSDAPEPQYPIRVTAHQRDALVSWTRLNRKVRDRLKAAPEGTQVIRLTRNELDDMFDELGKAALVAPSPYTKRVLAVQKKVADALGGLQLAELGSEQTKGRQVPGSASERLYQFKITLLESRPPIWRRIQVGNCTLDKLHQYIQSAMGWTNSHLHQFEIQGERYGDPGLLDDGFEDFCCIDSTDTMINEIVPKDGKRFRFLYEYDFGDDWRHELLFEGYVEPANGGQYPLCVDGARNCPPEDVGGVWGYTDFLEAITDPGHAAHEQMLEWSGKFDPDEFDPRETTEAMRRGLPNWRLH
ncbi:MAG: plasmid pRiA4b ORF-3 family protein [Planctomycetaceae bacterium]